MRITVLAAAVLTALVLATSPVSADMKSGKGMMDGKGMTMGMDMWGDMMTMMKDTMTILRDVDHKPSDANRARLDAMIKDLDERIKWHEEYAGKGRKMGGQHLEMMKETLTILRDLNHKPTAGQKEKLDKMIKDSGEMIEWHNKMMEKRMKRMGM